MSLPPLRQPKCLKNRSDPKPLEKVDEYAKGANIQHVIITLKSNKKLVIPCDRYHGIIQSGDMYRCLFCDTDMELNVKKKELHKRSSQHQKTMERFPHMEDFKEDLIRKINSEVVYCTTCNVAVLQYKISGHLRSDVHKEELSKAINKATIYKAVK